MFEAVELIVLTLQDPDLRHEPILIFAFYRDKRHLQLLLGGVHSWVETFAGRVEVFLEYFPLILVQSESSNDVTLVERVLLNAQEQIPSEAIKHTTDGLLDVKVVDGVLVEQVDVFEFKSVVLLLIKHLIPLERLSATNIGLVIGHGNNSEWRIPGPAYKF